jgi:hypothetical protein
MFMWFATGCVSETICGADSIKARAGAVHMHSPLLFISDPVLEARPDPLEYFPLRFRFRTHSVSKHSIYLFTDRKSSSAQAAIA